VIVHIITHAQIEKTDTFSAAIDRKKSRNKSYFCDRSTSDENFKPIKLSGEMVPESDSDFIYDSGSKRKPSQAVCMGIAKRLRIKGAKAMKPAELIRVIDARLENLKQLEKSKMSQYEESKAIIEEMSGNGKTEDEIIIALVQQGVSYKEVVKLYERACVDLGLKSKPMKPADRNNKVAEILIAQDFKPETYQDILDAVNTCAADDALKNQTASQLLTAVRVFCKDNELDFPKRPKEKVVRVTAVHVMSHFIATHHADEDVEAQFEAKVKELDLPKARANLFFTILNQVKDSIAGAEEPVLTPKKQKAAKPTTTKVKKAAAKGKAA
jgi:hypothetical protein